MTISLPSCGNDDEPEETTSTGKADVDDNRIYGTWEGSFFGDDFVLTFKENGTLTESVNGEEGNFNYSLKNGILKITPSGSALENVMGDEIQISFKGNNNMVISCKLWDMEMKKK